MGVKTKTKMARESERKKERGKRKNEKEKNGQKERIKGRENKGENIETVFTSGGQYNILEGQVLGPVS